MVGYSDNCRLWKHDVYFLLPGEQILSHSLRFKENRGYLSLSILFSAVSFYGFRENYYVGVSLLIVFLYFIYHNEK
jgi:hypothetical protein